jgi:hypothetical protein
VGRVVGQGLQADGDEPRSGPVAGGRVELGAQGAGLPRLEGAIEDGPEDLDRAGLSGQVIGRGAEQHEVEDAREPEHVGRRAAGIPAPGHLLGAQVGRAAEEPDDPEIVVRGPAPFSSHSASTKVSGESSESRILPGWRSR